MVGNTFDVIDVTEERVHQFIKNIRKEKIKTGKLMEKGYFYMERISVRTNVICSMYSNNSNLF